MLLISFICFVLQLCALGLFAKGFFPRKVVLSGLADFHTSSAATAPAQFDRLIFMVVDALRTDFAFGNKSNFRYLHELINNGKAIPFTAFSSPPTVTLPRLKGLTTGSTPSFLDAILNIAESDTSSTLSQQDTWVAQMARANRSIHMFGDDTWLKLFPGAFKETDGTASFFVSDFVEVDTNVTRHLDHSLSEAGMQEWDTLILHYLGLDHIGHKGGPGSVFMPDKQQEMDTVLKQLVEATHNSEDKSLIVLLGDHGMNEAGNHGGSSEGETSATLVFISELFEQRVADSYFTAPSAPHAGEFEFYRKVSQTDLVPTLSALFNLPIPKNSLGLVLKELLELWDEAEQKNILMENAHELATLLKIDHHTWSASEQMFCQSTADFTPSVLEQLKCTYWMLASSNSPSVENLYSFLSRAQEHLAGLSSAYKDKEMLMGLALSIASVILSLIWLFRQTWSPPLYVLEICAGLYFLSMFGSSLVEEEHHFWYWGATGWFAWLYINTARRSFSRGLDWAAALCLVRIVRSWNQTGQKYAGSPDIVKFLSDSNLLWVLNAWTYLSVLGKLTKGPYSHFGPFASFMVGFVTVASSIVFKVNFAALAGEYVPPVVRKLIVLNDLDGALLINLARVSMMTIGAGILYEITTYADRGTNKQPVRNLATLCQLFLLNQSRVSNIPLFGLFDLISDYLEKAVQGMSQHGKVVDVTILVLQHVSFFAMGNSNSLASVDLSNAYNGVASYNIPIVSLLTFVSNWAGPIYWSFAGYAIKEKLKYRGSKVMVNQVFFSLALTGIMSACIALKTHLFIWTVFSPKLLYAAAWVGLLNGFDLLLAVVCESLRVVNKQ